MLTIVDDCTRECPAIEVDTSLGGLRVRRVLDRIASERGLPEAIVLDNGPEFRARALAAWSAERGVRLEFIQPGKTVQNAYVESFNGRLRDECLNANWFTSLSDARRKIETWRQDYNQQRPHSSLDYLPPAEFETTPNSESCGSGVDRKFPSLYTAFVTTLAAALSSRLQCLLPHPNDPTTQLPSPDFRSRHTAGEQKANMLR